MVEMTVLKTDKREDLSLSRLFARDSLFEDFTAANLCHTAICTNR